MEALWAFLLSFFCALAVVRSSDCRDWRKQLLNTESSFLWLTVLLLLCSGMGPFLLYSQESHEVYLGIDVHCRDHYQDSSSCWTASLRLFTVSMDVIVSFRDKRFLGSWHQYSSKVSYWSCPPLLLNSSILLWGFAKASYFAFTDYILHQILILCLLNIMCL